jgi:hypothetical protein
MMCCITIVSCNPDSMTRDDVPKAGGLVEESPPASWDAREMKNAVLRIWRDQPGCAQIDQKGADIRFLTWKSREKAPTSYREICLAWGCGKNDHGKEVWLLSIIVRFPRVPGEEQWCRPFVSWPMWPHDQLYEHAPTNEDVYEFLMHRDLRPGKSWQFTRDQGGGFRLIRGGVCAKTWNKVIGKPPLKYYEH